MFSFQQLVESLLLEDKQSFLTQYGPKISGTSDAVLTAIFQLVQKGQKTYVSGDAWAQHMQFTPLFSAIILAMSNGTGTLQDARNNWDRWLQTQTNKPKDEDSFYEFAEGQITANPNYANTIKEFDSLTTQEKQNLAKDVKDIHSAASRKKSNQVLIQNVWPSIQKLTVVDAVTTLLKNRLTTLEGLKLHFFTPLNTMNEPMIDGIMKDVFYNLEAYSKGSKKYSADIVEILKNINIVPEDFAKVATHTVQLYKQLITDKFTNPTYLKDVLTDSLTNDNIYNFAKTGIFYYVVNGKKKQPNASDKYTLNFIEALHVTPGDELIEQIKSMSSGMRVKDQSFLQLLANTGKALGAVTQNIGPVN